MIVKVRKLLRKILAITFIIAFFIASWFGLRYISVDDSSSYTRLTMHEFYNQENIDILFMGASHCYRGFDTNVTDEMLGCNTFNLGSSSQLLDTTYLLMREAVETNDIDHIYVDLSYNVSKESIKRGENLTSAYIITDYMRPSLKKIAFLLNKSGEGNYSNSFLAARRNWQNIFDLRYVYSVLMKKGSPEYLNFAYIDGIDGGKERYAGKGFVENDREIADGSFKDTFENETFNLDDIDEDWITIVKKMIKYCDNHNVKLTFISVPISSYRLLCYKDYDSYISFIEGIISESGSNKVNYIDFNLMREKYWPDTSTYYIDYSHLNTLGAKEFSRVFCQYINGSISEEELFYSSISEKYENTEANFYGLEYETSPDGKSIHCHMIASRPNSFQSKVTFYHEGREYVLKELSDGLDFGIPSDFSGVCKVEILYCNGTSKYYEISF
jgi:hypothetical protein